MGNKLVASICAASWCDVIQSALPLISQSFSTLKMFLFKKKWPGLIRVLFKLALTQLNSDQTHFLRFAINATYTIRYFGQKSHLEYGSVNGDLINSRTIFNFLISRSQCYKKSILKKVSLFLNSFIVRYTLVQIITIQQFNLNCIMHHQRIHN